MLFRSSPTGYPFKVIKQKWKTETADIPRRKVCDLGYLREAFLDDKGKVDFRCPAECTKNYLRKGGSLKETEGKLCLCNSLMATVGYPQVRKDFVEPPLLTGGSDFEFMEELASDKSSFKAADVIELVSS